MPVAAQKVAVCNGFPSYLSIWFFYVSALKYMVSFCFCIYLILTIEITECAF